MDLLVCSSNQHTLIQGSQHTADSMLGIAHTVGNRSGLGSDRDAPASPGLSWKHSKGSSDNQLQLSHGHSPCSQWDVVQRECPPCRPPPGQEQGAHGETPWLSCPSIEITPLQVLGYLPEVQTVQHLLRCVFLLFSSPQGHLRVCFRGSTNQIPP